MSAADILSMLKDRANGGRSSFLGAHIFLTDSLILILLVSIKFPQP
jgi:hypothetical protein